MRINSVTAKTQTINLMSGKLNAEAAKTFCLPAPFQDNSLPVMNCQPYLARMINYETYRITTR